MGAYTTSDMNKARRGANRATYNVEKINKILDAGFIGHVSHLHNGLPMSLPMAYGRMGDKIYLHGSLKNRMLLSLLEHSLISMTVMHLDALVLARSGLHHSVNYRSATIFGRPRKLENVREKEEALKCIVDHMIVGRWDGIRPMLPKELAATLVIEVSIETASAKIRDVGVKDEKKDLTSGVWAGLVPLKQVAEYPISDALLPAHIGIPEHVIEYYEQNK